MKKRIIWYNFFKLMGIGFTMILFAMLMIYRSSVSVTRDQFLQINEQKVEILSDNMASIIDQTNRIASSLCVDNEAFLFFGDATPERIDDSLYERIQSKLKTFSFGIEHIHSIVLYSPQYSRVVYDSSKDAEAMPLQNAIESELYDISWIDEYKEMKHDENSSLTFIRAVNNRYPYVLTMIREYSKANVTRVAIVNLDLKTLYSSIWTETEEKTKVYVLDEEGRIVIQNGKTHLFEDRGSVFGLNHFSPEKGDWSVFITDSDLPYTYTQSYDSALGLYYVVVSSQEDYLDQMMFEQIKLGIIFLVCILALSIVVLIYCTTSYRPFQSIMELLENPKGWQSSGAKSESQIKEIADQIFTHLQKNENLRNELDQRLGMLRETQVQALQSQFNPHFLFNTLDVIGLMIEDREGSDAEALQMLDNLISILRYSISGQELVTIENELIYLEKYIFIMKHRYGDEFCVAFDFAEEAKHAMIPKLILQPLIENAIFHGIAARDDDIGGVLTVRGVLHSCPSSEHPDSKDYIRIEVEDNGKGMSKQELEKQLSGLHDLEHIATNHIGLQNSAKRLYLLFPGKVKVTVDSKEDKGTCVKMVFPKIDKTEVVDNRTNIES